MQMTATIKTFKPLFQIAFSWLGTLKVPKVNPDKNNVHASPGVTLAAGTRMLRRDEKRDLFGHPC